MPFLNQITEFINDVLKAGSLNKAKLQPAKYYGIATSFARKKDTGVSGKPMVIEMLPAILEAGTIKNFITADSKVALQIYHKVISNVYSYEKKSYGDNYDIKCSTDMNMVALFNSKQTGSAKEVLEPVILFGMPQKLSNALIADLKIIKCLITPVSSNMDPLSVFKQEYPQADFILNENTSMFSIRYRIEMTFSQACVDNCLC
ncbi:MAG: hypothetical protein ABI237_05945 [Ginsengibacter sp.]